MTGFYRSISALLASLLVWIPAAPSFSQSSGDVPLVAVVGLRSLDNLLEKQFRTYFIEELGASNRVSVVPDGVTATRVDEVWSGQRRESTERLDQAYQAFLKGKRLYDQLELDDAIKSLSEAVRGYREGIATLRDNRFLLESHLHLGMALVIRGNVNEGREFIRQMVVLDPQREKHRLPSKQFPPKIVALHSEVTREVLKNPMGTIVLRTIPTGADIFLDGMAQFPSPVNLTNVPPGEHFLTAQKKGYGRFSERVVVRPGENVLEPKLDEWQPLAPYPSGKRSDHAFNTALKGLGSGLGSSILVIGSMAEKLKEKYLVSAQLYDTRSKEFSRIESIEVDMKKVKKSAEVLAKKLLSNLTNHGLVVAEINQESAIPGIVATSTEPQPEQQPSTLAEGKPFYKKWWFWTLVGAVVVGGGTFAYLQMKPESPNSHLLVIPNPTLP